MHRLSDVHRTELLACALLGVLMSAAAFAVASRLEVDARIRQDNGEVAQRSVAPGAVLRTGDDVRLRVTPWADGYLYVVALGSSGSAVVLHPFDGPAELARAGETLAVPRDGGYLPLDSRTGRETLLTFASDKPVESLPRLLVRLEAAGAAGDGASLREVLAMGGRRNAPDVWPCSGAGRVRPRPGTRAERCSGCRLAATVGARRARGRLRTTGCAVRAGQSHR